MNTIHKFYYSTSAEMTHIENESIDLVVTSPPYPMVSMWDEMFIKQNKKIGTALKSYMVRDAFELMHRELDHVWKELYRTVKKGGFACINIGDAVRTINKEFSIFPNHSRIISAMISLGFTCLPSIIWRKQTNAPNKFMGSGMLPAGAYITLEHEFVLIFRKGSKRIFKHQADKQNRHESAVFWEERNSWFSDVWMDLKGSRQSIVEKNVRQRSAAYPFELPYRLINMYSVKGDTILDPFTGIGTTSLAAICSGRSSVNYEIEENFRDIINERIETLVQYSDQLIVDRLDNHVKFVKTRLADGKLVKHHNSYYDFPVMTNQEKKLVLDRLISLNKEMGNCYAATLEKSTSFEGNVDIVRKEWKNKDIKKKPKQMPLFG